MKKMKIIGLTAVVLLIVGVAGYFLLADKEYKGYEVVQELEISDVLEYAEVDGALVRCGREGAQAIAKDGTLLWNVTYSTMKNPKFVFCGSVMAVADIGAKQYLISDGTGSTKTFSTPYPIQMISVAEQGVTAVLMNGEEKDYIYLYSKEGELYVEIETVVARDGFPLAVALSKDGKKLITSYMKVERDEPVSSVTFYNFDEVGQNYNSNLVGQVQYPECMVPRIEFWDNDTALVMGENVMELFRVKEVPEPLHKKEITAEVKSIAFGDYFCTVTKNKDGQEVLEAYNKSGEVCMKKVISLPYVGLNTAGDEIVLYSYSGCEVYDIKKGLLTYQGTFENGIRQMFVIGGNRYYLVENRLVRVIKLV
ncbi:MAG: hypothetical protein IKT67_07855 [Lachnospiraceae bacterium]|nr:hypothetical protein [Lachnospiraceae bacterium]